MRRSFHRFSRAAAVLAITAALGVAAHAAGPGNKPNGDAPDDLAPLGKAGDNNTESAVAKQNTPPIGGATQGGGGNPKENGAVDAQRASGNTGSGEKVQPDNK